MDWVSIPVARTAPAVFLVLQIRRSQTARQAVMPFIDLSGDTKSPSESSCAEALPARFFRCVDSKPTEGGVSAPHASVLQADEAVRVNRGHFGSKKQGRGGKSLGFMAYRDKISGPGSETHGGRTFLHVALALMILASGCGAGAGQYLEKGRKSLALGLYGEAEINYRKALQKDNKLGEAYFGLGNALLHESHSQDAYTNLSRAAEILPQRKDVTATLADAALAAYLQTHAAAYYNKVLEIASRLLAEDPKSYDGLRLKGSVAMLDRHYGEAVDLLGRADAIRPLQEDVTLLLVQSLIENNQGPEAEKAALALIHEKKTLTRIYDTLYLYYMSANRQADAESLLKAKVANNPESIQYRLELASFYVGQGNEGGLSSVVHELDDGKRFPDALMSLGDFYDRIHRADSALGYFQRGIRDDPQRKVDYQKRMAEVLLGQGKRDQARVFVEEVLKENGKDFDARLMRAGILVDSGQAEGLAEGLKDLQVLAKERPADTTVRVNLGKALLRSSDPNRALQEFKEAHRLNPGLLDARLLAANSSLQTKDYRQAGQYADDVLQTDQNNALARLIRVKSLAGMGNLIKATSEARTLGQDFPNEIEPKLELGALLLTQKKFGDAEALFRSLYAADRKNVRALQGLVDTLVAENRYDSAIQLLAGEAAKSGSVEVREMFADVALRGGRIDLAIREYGDLSKASPGASFYSLRLGDAYLQSGNPSEAVSHLQEAKSVSPKDPTVNSMLALSLQRAGRIPEAVQAYRLALTLDPNNALTMNNLAYLLTETGGSLEDAARLAYDASRRQPENTDLSDTLGWVYLKQGMPDKALPVLDAIVKKNPRQPVYRYHLASALFQKGDKANARLELLAALEDKPGKADQAKIADLLTKVQ